MALAQATLATKIKDNIISQMGVAPADAAQLDKMAQAIAKAVVDEIQQNAVVLPTSMVAPDGGGSVTGTGTIT